MLTDADETRHRSGARTSASTALAEEVGSTEHPGGPDNAPSPGKSLGYMPGLDGLRAIAVLGVLLYHAGLTWMPGGFLGVDLFFVLSGFLITSLVLGELGNTGRLDFKKFYIRRARRLLPAMLLTLVFAALIAATIAPDAASAVRRDIPAAFFYVTNWVYVFADVSYFEAIGRPPLLQHLWSLAVEEQFYLIWPAVVFFAFRRGRSVLVRRVAVIGAVGSTALMVIMSLANSYPVPNDGSAAYFNTFAHMMGLMVGAGLATFWHPSRIRADVSGTARLLIDAVAVLALVLTIGAFVVFDDFSSFLYRGGFLVFSVLVGLLVAMVTHPASRVGLLLGRQPMRYIGERSYGLYLYHWPVFLILRPGIDTPLTGLANVVLQFAVTFAIAELSYRYVELPIRHGALGRWWKRIRSTPVREAAVRYAQVATALAVVVLIGFFLTGRLASNAADSEAIPDYLDGATEISALDQLPGQTDTPNPSEGTTQTPSPSPSAEQSQAPAKPTKWSKGKTAVGESVMLGARSGLFDAYKGLRMDASVSRQATDFPPIIRSLQANGALAETVIVHTGSNGYIERETLVEIMELLKDRERVVIVNAHVPRRWSDPNNELIDKVVSRYDNAVVADWDALAGKNRDYLVADGVHLTGSGIDAYAKLVDQAVASFGKRPPQAEPTSATSDGGDS